MPETRARRPAPGAAAALPPRYDPSEIESARYAEWRSRGYFHPPAGEGPPPYTIYRIEPSTVFGLPGMFGMDEFDPSELPRPTRWDFTT